MSEGIDPGEVAGDWIGESVRDHQSEFAGTREVVCHHSPARVVILKEGKELEQKIAAANDKLNRLVARGVSAERIDAATEARDALVDAWAEWAGAQESPGAGDGGSDLDNYISISDLITRDLDWNRELTEEEMRIRMETLKAVCRYVTQDGFSNIWLAFKNFLAVLRRVYPDMIPGQSKQAVAQFVEESRAATSNREIRLVEAQLKLWGFRGFHLDGTNKGEETREKNRKAAKGNKNRKKGGDRF